MDKSISKRKEAQVIPAALYDDLRTASKSDAEAEGGRTSEIEPAVAQI